MGIEKGKRLVSDGPEQQLQSQAGSARPPSRRSDDDMDDRPPPSPTTRQRIAELANNGRHAEDYSGGQRNSSKQPQNRKEAGPGFPSQDDKARRTRLKTRMTSAKGGSTRLHRIDDGEDRQISLGAQEMMASADSYGDKKISCASMPRKNLKETGPEFSPEDNNTNRKAVSGNTTMSRKSDVVRRRDGANEKGNRLSTRTTRQVKQNTHQEQPSFYDGDVIDSMTSTKPPPVSNQAEFSPDYSIDRTNKSRKKLHTSEKISSRRPFQQHFAKSSIRESGVKRTLPTNVASITVEEDEDEKLIAKASLSQDRASVPGTTAVSPLKQSAKSLKWVDEPQIYSVEKAVYRDTKTPVDSSKKVSQGKKGTTDSVDDSLLPEGSVDMSSTGVSAETKAAITPNFQPRPPRNRTTPGAFRVDGLDGPSDYEFYDDEVSETMPHVSEGISSLPVAKPANESKRDIIDGLGEAEPLSPDDLKGQGIMGWIRQHKVWSAIAIFVVIGAVVGGVVGAKLVSVSPPPAPTSEPTLAPTSAPTLSGFEAIADTLLTVTPYSVLTDPTTPQNAAMTWLMREDGYGIDFGSSSKLLQRYSLATIYFATGGGNWTNQLQFLTNQDDCFWNDTIGGGSFGVIECNDQGLATKLQLSRNGLQGTLPDEVEGMPLLVEFGAADSSLSGSVPNGLTKLNELVDIYLFESGLSGTLPKDIGNLIKLTHLALQTNSLSGSLPTSFYDLTSLENMYLLQNSFSGSLASGIGNFVSLKQMQLNANRFTGVIPSDVAGMTSLVNIFLDENEFTGGMENFCALNFQSFSSDCFKHDTIAPDPEVECSCCTECCRNEDTASAICVPNNVTFI